MDLGGFSGSVDLWPCSFRIPNVRLNLFSAAMNYALDKLLLLFMLALHLSTFILKAGFDENQQTYKWILYTLVNVTQLGPVDRVQLNIKLVTDWLMEDGAALGRHLCGRNDTPLVTVSEVNAITLSNSELATRISFIPPSQSLHSKSFPQPTAMSADF